MNNVFSTIVIILTQLLSSSKNTLQMQVLS